MCMYDLGTQKLLQNFVSQCMQMYKTPCHPMTPADQQKEPISYIRKSQVRQEIYLPHIKIPLYTFLFVNFLDELGKAAS